MPDFTKCVKYKEAIYCWNNETRNIAILQVHDVNFTAVPTSVIKALIMAKDTGLDIEAVDAMDSMFRMEE